MIRKLAIVLPTVSPLGGGVAEAAKLHVRALSGSGIDKITVHTLDPSLEKVDREQWLPADFHLHRFFGPKSYSFAPGMVKSLSDADPDLVHVHGVWQFQCAATWLWSLKSGKPYVVSPHGMLEPWIRARSRRLKGAVSSLYQNRFLEKCAAFHLLTEKEAQDVREFRTDQPARIIRNYAPAFETDGQRPGWWRDTFEGRNIYLFLGRIHEKKGCMELMAAWEDLCLRDAGFRDRSVLVFCGWNDGIAGFEERAADLGHRLGNVMFAGPQYGPDKARSIAACRYFILPSKSEGLPMAVLEAWSAGKPAILTPECNLPIGFEREAALLSGFTPETIFPALVKAHSLSDTEWSSMSEKAQRLAAEEFSQESVRDGLLELYRDAEKWRTAR